MLKINKDAVYIRNSSIACKTSRIWDKTVMI